jgi:DNA-binding transcriptional MerR regulator
MVKYQIGDFSKISRLSVKTLRFYHECGLLEPSEVDDSSGYRYYTEKSLEKVRVIQVLKELDFSLKEIKTIVETDTDDSELLDFLHKKADEVRRKIIRYAEIQEKLALFIRQEEEFAMTNQSNEMVIKDIPDILIASIRFKGIYSEVSGIFGKLMRHCGRYCNGIPFCLYYDADYKDDDADIEVCIPVKQAVNTGDITSRKIQGGKALTKIHQGPYETIGESYKVIFDYVNSTHMKIALPHREVYLKGPGLILPRNPKKFVTEIQMVIES